LKKLSKLVLINIRITDTGLARLKGPTNLAVLHLCDNLVGDITDAGVKELQQALPRLKVTR
jgi:hypothetical protein